MGGRQYTITQIASILNIKNPPGNGEGFIDTLLTDSRKLTTPATSLFFALKGPQRNGHLFINELYKKGVRHFVVNETIDTAFYPDAVFFRVAGCLTALQAIAAFHRHQFHYNVIGITGSNGKTVVKEWLYQLLQLQYKIVRSPKSYNSQLGVPLSVWQMTDGDELAIFEAGISRLGEMAHLQKIIDPTIGILTNIGLAHSEGFSSNVEKLQEKLRLFSNSKILISNGDTEWITGIVKAQNIPLFTWGIKSENDLQVLAVSTKGAYSQIQLKIKDTAEFEMRIPFTDQASIENAVTSVAVLVYMGIAPAVITEGVKHLQAVNMRMEFKQGINNSVIINDSYSADLTSLEVALQFLKQQARDGRKSVILSDFFENDANDDFLYQSIYSLLKRYEVNRLIGIGKKMQQYLGDLVRNQDEIVTAFYIDTAEFLEQYHSTQYSNEFILVKGARQFGFERIVNQLEQKVHETVLEINLDAVAHNLKHFQQQLKPGVKLMAMVKAFAYGSGAAEIANVVQFHKADYLGVAYADEGVELRKAGITIPIMVLNTEETAFDAITDYNLEPDLFSFKLIDAFEQHIKNIGVSNYPVHIELETGMNRSGFASGEIHELGRRLRDNTNLQVQSCFSHLAASEDKVEDAFTLHQYHLLVKGAGILEKELGYSFIKHIANTSAILRFPQLQLDMVRLGIGLYGISGTSDNGLETVATLRTTISQVKKIKKGETVSYNRRGVAKEDSKIATIRIGYADGYSRRLGNGIGKVFIKGQLAPVIGTVCMDMTMIDITNVPNVAEGDDVIVFGKPVAIQQVAEWIGTIPYEIMTGISQRVKRVYYGEG